MTMGPLQICYQNTDFIALDKPAGLSVHNEEDPLNLIKVMTQQLGEQKYFPVHRLDKETSGIQIMALNEKAAKKLAQEFEQRQVKKIYIGILRGQFKIDNGVWNQPLSDKAEGRRSPAGQPKDHVACETRFQVIERSKYFTFCEFDLITGRQHQIRKHAAVNEHALVGDPRYGDKKYNARIAELYKTDRLFLHCSQIEIMGEKFICPLPLDFSKLNKPT